MSAKAEATTPNPNSARINAMMNNTIAATQHGTSSHGYSKRPIKKRYVRRQPLAPEVDKKERAPRIHLCPTTMLALPP